MSNQKERIFADGFRFQRRENAPEYVIGRLSIKVEDAISFLKTYEKSGWVNLNILTGRSGNPYVELDTYEPKKGGDSDQSPAPAKQSQPSPEPQAAAGADDDGDLPF